MIIKHGCVKLRAVEKKDSDLLFYLINAPEIENTIIGWNFPINRITHDHWVETFNNSMKSIKLMIELTNAKTIGMAILDDIDWKNRTATFGLKIHAPLEDRIKGDTFDATNGMLKYAFDELGMNCITGIIQKDNTLSLNLAKKAGFIEEGILRKRLYKSGRYMDLVSLSLLKEEFNL